MGACYARTPWMPPRCRLELCGQALPWSPRAQEWDMRRQSSWLGIVIAGCTCGSHAEPPAPSTASTAEAHPAEPEPAPTPPPPPPAAETIAPFVTDLWRIRNDATDPPDEA